MCRPESSKPGIFRSVWWVDTRKEAKDKGQRKSMVGNGMVQCHHHLVTSVQTALLLLMSTSSCGGVLVTVCVSLLCGTVFFISSRSTLSTLLVSAELSAWLSCWLSCSWSCCWWFWLSARTRSSLRSEVTRCQGSQRIWLVGGSVRFPRHSAHDC